MSDPVTAVTAIAAALGIATAIAAALGIAAAAGARHKRRASVLREPNDLADPLPTHLDSADLGLSSAFPTIVHFTAQWCGPCAAARRVIEQVCADLPRVAHVEIDIDAQPAAARRLSVLSLPTTFIFDTDGGQRYRSSGVPKAIDLRAAIKPLLA